MTITHTKDEHCAPHLINDCCALCGVVFGDPCPECSKRGFHADDCSENYPGHPRIEILDTGEAQTVIEQTPPRNVPTTALKPKRKQNDKPTLLEMYHEEVKQTKLF